MKFVSFSLVTALIVFVCDSDSLASPIVPGLANKHSLTEPQVGQLLISELRCAACHGPKDTSQTPERLAPDLSEVGGRISPDYLKKFIASPSAAHSGSTMPDMLAAETAEEREKIAEALTHFLVSQSPRPFQRDPIDEKQSAQGKTLFHSVGCVACHSPRDDQGKETTREGVIDLGHIPVKYGAASLEKFVHQPLIVRPSGRMPDMKLTPSEAKSIANYLLGKGEKSEPLKPRDEFVTLGKKYFQQFNCASCHKMGEIPAAAAAIDLYSADTKKGCLSATPSKAPQYQLSEKQAQAIRAALAKKSEADTDKIRIAKTLATFNCTSCHVRDDIGGVSTENNPLFGTSEKELGDEARIPPPLTLVGAKLQTVAMKKMLFDGDSVRPYMFTRMPQFGEPNLRHLPELFSRLDEIKKVDLPLPKSEAKNQADRDYEKEMRAGGRELVGDKGLYCIACHSFNGKAPNKAAIDMNTFAERLKPSWYYRYMLDPGAYRPRAVMPTAWPGGEAVYKTILKGDTDKQIAAIWHYLSLGTSAQDPSGLRNAETILSVTEAARTYRGRSNVAGFRGIAVGFPEKLSYAFNAETGTLTAIWPGEFVKVNRSGQGSGNFTPAAKFVPLAQDVSFFDLPDEKTPWPLRPTMTKEAPVNPDPLYPKNRGYQFKGYSMDDASIPTFEYKSGEIAITDRSSIETVEKKLRLIRKFTFDSPKECTIWFRALTGKIESKEKTSFKTTELQLSIPDVHTLLRPNSADPKTEELLLKFDLPKGKSTRTLTYELLK